MKELKTVLCSFNSKYIHSCLAVHSLVRACEFYSDKYKASCGNLVIMEFTINDIYDSIICTIAAESPDIVAMSTYIWNVNVVSRLCKDIRKALPSAVIILGGPEVSFGLEHTSISNADYDYIVKGEGERAFFSLLASLNDDKFVIPGEFGYVLEANTASAASINNLSEIPFVYDGYDMQEVFTNKIVYYESSRGCPFRCSYCLSAACGNVRFLPLERVFDDLYKMMKSGIRQVKFVDRTFNCNRERAYEIVKFITEEASQFDINFHFEVGADLFDFEFLTLLSKVRRGQIQLEVGIQSTYGKALEVCCRSASMDKLFSNVNEIVGKGNVNVHVDLIAGLPMETYERFKVSFNDTYALKAHQLQLGFLKLLAGAPLNGLVHKYRYVFSEHSPYEIIRNDSLSYMEISRLKRIEDVLEKYYNSRRFCTSIDLISEAFETPFEMYEAISEFFEETGNTFRSIASRELYDILVDFVSEMEVGREWIYRVKNNMLFDYFSSEHSDCVPVKLRDIWRPYTSYKREAKAIMNELGIKNDAHNIIRFIDDIPYMFDYSKRDPVTGCFKAVRCRGNV